MNWHCSRQFMACNTSRMRNSPSSISSIQVLTAAAVSAAITTAIPAADAAAATAGEAAVVEGAAVAEADAAVAAAVATEASIMNRLSDPSSMKPHIAPRDRVGLGWRDELAADIICNLDRIDILEVIAENLFHAGKDKLQAMRRLALNVPISLHGVAMGLASAIPVEVKHAEKMARLANAIKPESWSEHLSFVRAGGVEIGHLAAPPRTAQTVAGAIRNIGTAARIVGSKPQLENIATLIAPPASAMDEAQWIAQITGGADCALLLDLHNLYANAVNFGIAPADLLLRFPLARVRNVHLSGGHWIPEPDGDPSNMRLLDDHVHDVPQEVFDLLALLAQHAPQALTVILERDGNYPQFGSILAELDAARAALARGRQLARRCA